MRITLPLPGPQHRNNQSSGQAFLEFLMVLMILIGLSFTLLAGINAAVGVRWEVLVKLISNPTTTNIKLR